jgi:transcriptional regulator with XRE-family HTH domain
VASRPVTDFDRAVSAYVRSTAGIKKLGQDETAERAGIHPNTFRHYWRGERSISLGDFRTILSVFGVTSQDAMKDVERIFASGDYND